MLYCEFLAMNSAVEMAAQGEEDLVEAGFAQARRFIEESEARFSRFSPESELSRLNRSAGVWFQASPELFEVCRQAQDLATRTRGLFDPSILPSLRRAGYDRSMDAIRGQEVGGALTTAPTGTQGFCLALFDANTRRIRLPSEMAVDLGGIAKGWIAEEAARRLAEFSTACTVSAGGDMFLVGLPVGEAAWRLSLEDPADPDRDLAWLRSGPGGIATSSVSKRRWLQDGHWRHHVIDPRTGEPADAGWMSVTVLAPHTTEAEAFAKALLIAGPARAGQLVLDEPSITYIAADGDGRLWNSRETEDLLEVQFSYA
jgi:thiamine biosynthesis lipoprotein